VKKFILALFSENGGVSMMRVMSLICCLAAIVITYVGLCKAEVDYTGLSILSGTFLSAAFGGKLVQKHLETSGSTYSSKNTKLPLLDKSQQETKLQT
jgi:hypothetical protein